MIHAVKSIEILNNFCSAINEYDYKGEEVFHGRMILETTELKETQADISDMRRKRSIYNRTKVFNSRKRRSN